MSKPKTKKPNAQAALNTFAIALKEFVASLPQDVRAYIPSEKCDGLAAATDTLIAATARAKRK